MQLLYIVKNMTLDRLIIYLINIFSLITSFQILVSVINDNNMSV